MRKPHLCDILQMGRRAGNACRPWPFARSSQREWGARACDIGVLAACVTNGRRTVADPTAAPRDPGMRLAQSQDARGGTCTKLPRRGLPRTLSAHTNGCREEPGWSRWGGLARQTGRGFCMRVVWTWESENRGAVYDLVFGVVIEPRSHGLGPTKQHYGGSHRKCGCPAAQPHADGVENGRRLETTRW